MLELLDIHKHFDDQPVLKGVSLSVEAGEILCLLGSSGCGKTTLLRIIAGLEHPDQGSVQLHRQRITHVPVHQRDMGLMFQDFALFPHLNVEQNIAFGLKMRKSKTSTERVAAMLRLVGLDGFNQRAVTELSGGEQQRVALARSLAPDPRLLMLDEPLGSLDAALRDRLVVDLRQIIKAAGVTAIYVTHDQQEAFAIADRIVVMNAGRIEQISPPEKLYMQPETVFVAEFLGLNNILKVESQVDQMAQTAIGVFELDETATHLLLHPSFGEQVADSGISLEVVQRVFKGVFTRLTLRHTSGTILQLQLRSAIGSLPHEGDMIQVQFAKQGIIPLKEHL